MDQNHLMNVDELNAFFGPLAPGLHGVVVADTLCAAGCGNHIAEGYSFTTIELKTNFLSSAREGERVKGVATPAHLGQQTHVWDVVVTNETTERTMALFRCTQMILSPR